MALIHRQQNNRKAHRKSNWCWSVKRTMHKSQMFNLLIYFVLYFVFLCVCVINRFDKKFVCTWFLNGCLVAYFVVHQNQSSTKCDRSREETSNFLSNVFFFKYSSIEHGVCVCVMCVKVHFFKSRLKISYTFTAQRYVLHFFSTHFQRIYNTLYKWFCVFVFFLQVC